MIKSTTLSPPISIHALVKRATEIHGIIKNNEIISIHALVKRATSSFASVIISSNYFNPRPRKEGDSFTTMPSPAIAVFQSTPS